MKRAARIVLAFLIINLPAGAQDVVLIGGTGSAGFEANVRIRDGRIAAVGSFEPRSDDRVVDVGGLVVSPGFVDIHNHSAGGLAEDPAAASQVAQGITTMALGPDVGGPFEVRDFLATIDANPSSVNILTFVGHGTVRRHVLGDDYRRQASDQELNAMEDLVVGPQESGFWCRAASSTIPTWFAKDISERQRIPVPSPGHASQRNRRRRRSRYRPGHAIPGAPGIQFPDARGDRRRSRNVCSRSVHGDHGGGQGYSPVPGSSLRRKVGEGFN